MKDDLQLSSNKVYNQLILSDLQRITNDSAS